MVLLTASAPDPRSHAVADETRTTAGHRFSSALGSWASWWRKGSHKDPQSAVNVSEGEGNAADETLRPDIRRGDIRVTDRRREASTASRSTTMTQPVLVRSYTGSKSRRASRATSATRTTQDGEIVSRTLTMTDADAKLPSIDDFKFTNLLVAASSDVSTAIDAIAEICARSRLSLADEYGAHLPPFSHTLPPMPRTRGQMHGQREVMRVGIGRLERTLTTVPETSSNSECSSPSTSSGKSGDSAYRALTKVLRRSGSGRLITDSEEQGELGGDVKRPVAMLWQVKAGAPQTIVVEVARPQISTETTASELCDTGTPGASKTAKATDAADRRTSWFQRTPTNGLRTAEGRLKELLKTTVPG